MPNTIIYSQHNKPAIEYKIDIYGDGIIDFDLWTFSSGWFGAGTNNCKIIPYNGNQICFAINDFCSGNIKSIKFQ